MSEEKEEEKIEVGYIHNDGVGYLRIGGKRVYIDIRAFEDLKGNIELVLNHYYLRKMGYKIKRVFGKE